MLWYSIKPPIRQNEMITNISGYTVHRPEWPVMQAIFQPSKKGTNEISQI
jgi:hypothetical protein